MFLGLLVGIALILVVFILDSRYSLVGTDSFENTLSGVFIVVFSFFLLISVYERSILGIFVDLTVIGVQLFLLEINKKSLDGSVLVRVTRNGKTSSTIFEDKEDLELEVVCKSGK